MNKKKTPYIFYAIILFFILYILFFDSASFLRRYLVKKEYNNLVEQIEKMEKVNQKLIKENEELETNLKQIEKKARELGMQKKGEEIFHFKEKK
jgi:cell division protein FtsB